MKNVTITLDEQLAEWAKVTAARSRKSLSRFIAHLLEELRSSYGDENETLAAFHAFSPRPLSKGKNGKLTREELHDRTRIP